MDVGGFAEPRKILCLSVLTSPLSNYQFITGRRDSAHQLVSELKVLVVFDFLLKNKSCQNCVLTIPLCRGGRDEATVENHVKNGRRNHPHAPARSLSTRADARHASHASSPPGWADPTRILDYPTHVTDPDTDDVSMT